MQFKSQNYLFRPTTLGAALVNAGLVKDSPHLVREAKNEGLLRQRRDSFNDLPSRRVELDCHQTPQRKTA